MSSLRTTLEPIVQSADMHWVPTGPGKAFRPLRFWDGGWSELMRLDRGAEVARHRHTGGVDAYVVEGQRLLATGEFLGAGDYQREPPGTVDAWGASGTEPCVVYLRIEGDIEYLDPNGVVTALVNSSTQAAAYREWCELHHAISQLHFDARPHPAGQSAPRSEKREDSR